MMVRRVSGETPFRRETSVSRTAIHLIAVVFPYQEQFLIESFPFERRVNGCNQFVFTYFSAAQIAFEITRSRRNLFLILLNQTKF